MAAKRSSDTLPEPYSLLLEAAAHPDVAELERAIEAVWTEVESHRTRALETLGAMRNDSLRLLIGVIALTIEAVREDENALRTEKLSPTLKRTVAALEITATSPNHYSIYGTLFAAFVFGSVVAFNRLGWSATPYVGAAVAVLVVITSFVTSRDYENVMRARMLDIIIRHRVSADMLCRHLAEQVSDLPNLAPHRHDMAKDLQLTVIGMVACWRGEQERRAHNSHGKE